MSWPQQVPESDAEVLRRVSDLVQDRLPAGWSLRVQPEPRLVGPRRPDALVQLRAPTGEAITFLVEVKRVVPPRELPHLLQQLRAQAQASGERDAVPMVVARYLPSSTRDWLVQENVAYADATGNIRILAGRPALFLRDSGAESDPWRGPGRPRGSLLGEPPARVVRALADFNPPLSVPRLVALSGASTGATYRVVQYLEEEALIRRTPRGPIEEVRWRELLERWARDYGFRKSNRVSSYLQPRGIPALIDGLAQIKDVRYAVTGSLAAQNWAPYAPASAAMIYAEDPHLLATRLRLRDVGAEGVGANVMIAMAAYDVVFDRTERRHSLTVVGPSQAVVDLMTGPGRNPAEAEALLDWMEAHVRQWRR